MCITLICIIHHTWAHKHTHSDCSWNWVMILVGAKILWEVEDFQFGFKRWQGCVSSLVGVNSKCGVQSKRRCESHESCVCIVGFPACGCQKKSVVYETECRHEAYETECRHEAVQRGKQDQNHSQHWNAYKLRYRFGSPFSSKRLWFVDTVLWLCPSQLMEH